jgi:hypothetical protein
VTDATLGRPAAGETGATQLGRDIQKQLGAPSIVVDRIIRRVATKRLKSKEGERQKPN